MKYANHDYTSHSIDDVDKNVVEFRELVLSVDQLS